MVLVVMKDKKMTAPLRERLIIEFLRVRIRI
jgi:hypothetical protein